MHSIEISLSRREMGLSLHWLVVWVIRVGLTMAAKDSFSPSVAPMVTEDEYLAN